jgi:hypothetical protein
MPLVRECGNHDVGNVVRIDERLTNVARGQRDFSGQQRREQVALTEVLVEPARTHQCPLDAGQSHDVFAALRLRFAPSGEQDNLSHAIRDSQIGKRPDVIGGALRRQIGVVRDVGRVCARDRCVPGRRIVPVEGRFSQSAGNPSRDPLGPEPLDHTAPGLAGPAQHQSGSCTHLGSSLRRIDRRVTLPLCVGPHHERDGAPLKVV